MKKQYLPFNQLVTVYQLFLVVEVVEHHVNEIAEIIGFLWQRVVEEVADKLEFVDWVPLTYFY